MSRSANFDGEHYTGQTTGWVVTWIHTWHGETATSYWYGPTFAGLGNNWGLLALSYSVRVWRTRAEAEKAMRSCSHLRRRLRELSGDERIVPVRLADVLAEQADVEAFHERLQTFHELLQSRHRRPPES